LGKNENCIASPWPEPYGTEREGSEWEKTHREGGVYMFREKIAEQHDRLGKNQKKIADFLTKEYREAAFMNGSALSAHLGVDPATVTRFAQRLGYTGYPDLLREIQELVKEELRAAYP
jgi:DNA-binding MurR/RpiR family transcriptional regulator